jgi:Protein of unknown function (DUF3054)
MPTASGATARGAFFLDALCVLSFCVIGRRSHGEAIDTAGLAETATPFLLGTAIVGVVAMYEGWPPTALKPTGVTMWLSTVIVGMVGRKVTGQGTALSFVVVASLSLAILLLGWRLGARVLARR